MVAVEKVRCVPGSANDDASLDLNAPLCENCNSRHVSLCGVLKDIELCEMSELVKNVTKHPKQIICSEGDNPEYLYSVKDGCVRLSKMLSDGRRQIIGFLFMGELFGFACENGYSCTAEAITNVDLCRMSRRALFEKFEKLPDLGHKMLEITQTDMDNACGQMLLLGRKKAKEKLCSFLIDINKKTSKIKDLSEDKIYLPMSRSDIADYLGLTIETVSRQFTILSKDCVISLCENTDVTILDRDRLNLIASGE